MNPTRKETNDMLSPQQRARRAAGLGPVAAAAALAAFPAAAGVAVALSAAAAALLTGAAPAHAQAAQRTPRYTNLVNERFATVSSGPQSALIVDVPSGASATDVQSAVVKRVRADLRSRSRRIAPMASRLRKAGAIKGRAPLPVSNVVMVRQNGSVVLPASKVGGKTRQVGGGRLTFRFTNFDQLNATFLANFIEEATPLINDVYGAPAASGEIEIVNIGSNGDPGGPSDVNALRAGYFSPSENRIYLPAYESQEESLLPALILNLLHAWHGPAVFQYDAWEQGFARAAAVAILRRYIPRVRIDNTLGANTLFGLMPFYDVLNQPGLGSPTFFPRSQENVDFDDAATEGFSAGKMILPRIAMSGAAWLKVYIENPNFFRQFNEAYYQRFTPGQTPSLAGNVPELKGIAAAIAPTVEGEPFEQWFRKQYVLDTSVSTGRKLYAFALPATQDPATQLFSHSVTLVYFQTVVQNGAVDEVLLGGQGSRVYATYFDSSGSTVRFGAESETFPIQLGEAFLTINAQPDVTRLTGDFTVGNDVARVYLPSGHSGDFNGAILGPGAGGTVQVEQTSISPRQTRSQSGNVEGSSFGVTLGTPAHDLAQTVITVTNGSVVQTFRRNTGDTSAWVVLRPDSNGGQVVTRTRSFPTGPVPSLVSFPLRPLNTDIGQALGGLSPENFLLSYWDPLASAGGAYQTAVSDPAASISAIQPGRGYWLKLYSPTNQAEVPVTLEGTPPPTDTDVTISAPLGWSLIGSPFEGTIDLSRVLVKYLQNTEIPWDEAVGKGYVAAEVTGWNRAAGQYQTTASLDGTNWAGYWLRVYVPGGVSLLLPGPDSAVTRSVGRGGPGRSAGKKANKPDWSVRLRARIDTKDEVVVGKTATAEFGAARGATRGFDNWYDRESPPPIVPGVSVTFPHTDFGRASGGRYVADFREPGLRGSYTVLVTAPRPGRVTLTWENLNSLPRNTQLTLVDKETGERVQMRSRSATTFEAQGDKLTRLFDVVAERGRSVPLMLSEIRLQNIPGRAADGSRRMAVTYRVSTEAEVQVELTSVTGRVLARLGGGRSEAAGTRSVTWDGRSAEGRPLPAGTYLVRVTATAGDGSRVVQLRPLPLLR